MNASEARAQYEEFKQLGLRLDMSRGKPSPQQLDLSAALLQGLDDHRAEGGIDVRNYGVPGGLPEARALFASLLDVPAAQVTVEGNASLALMHDVIVFGLLYGLPGHAPWRGSEPTSFLCPVPGYDRHFAICEALGINMINVPLIDSGPDMDVVEELVARDPAIKGMWCMPLYSNPSGVIYADDTVRRLAAMRCAAPDFRLLWDEAYRWHHLGEAKRTSLNVLDACAAAGNPDRAFVFASTSKVTLASAGLAVLASSPANIRWWQQRSGTRSIGPDKVNQLRHVRFLKDRAHVEAMMERHRALLRPKFDAVLAQFDALLGAIDGVRWSRPQGGYFIDLVTPPGIARRTIALAQEAGLTLTPAGAAFPYGRDPEDRHIRIVPSFPAVEEISQAAKGIALALRRALIE